MGQLDFLLGYPEFMFSCIENIPSVCLCLREAAIGRGLTDDLYFPSACSDK